jgi:hypothetical protein
MTVQSLALDLETYFDTQYSLSKMSLQEYVCSPCFRVHGMAVRHPDGRAEFRADVAILIEELRRAYGDRFERILVAMHNACFDYAILNWRYGLELRTLFDTRSAAYHVLGHAGKSGGRASLSSLASCFGFPAKGDLEFMNGVWEPDPVQFAQLAEYAINDVKITAALAEKLVPEISRPDVELPIIAHSARIFVERHLCVDAEALHDAMDLVQKRLKNELDEAGLIEEQVSSDRLFAELLNETLSHTGRSLPSKPGKRGAIPATARTDEAMQLLETDADPEVQKLVSVRLLKKSTDQIMSRLEYLDRVQSARGGKISFELVYHRAHTGRFAGGGGFNVQNIPAPKRARTRHGQETATAVRRCLIACPGHSLAAADASQIEARVLAYLAGQTELVDAFRSGRNVYADFGSECFGREVRKPGASAPPDVADKSAADYNISKAAVLGLGYSMGVERFVSTLKQDPCVAPLLLRGELGIPLCARIVHRYRERYPEIKALWSEYDEGFRNAINGIPATVGGVLFFSCGNEVRIQLPSSRQIRYPNARCVPDVRKIDYIDLDGTRASFYNDRPSIVYGKDLRLYGGKIVENVVQAVARDILVEAILRLERAGWAVVLHVHDEIILQVPSERDQDGLAAAVEALSTEPTWAPGLPLAAEGQIGNSLAM